MQRNAALALPAQEFRLVRELVGSMAIYATGDGIKRQALSPSPAWNKAAEEYLARGAARGAVINRIKSPGSPCAVSPP